MLHCSSLRLQQETRRAEPAGDDLAMTASTARLNILVWLLKERPKDFLGRTLARPQEYVLSRCAAGASAISVALAMDVTRSTAAKVVPAFETDTVEVLAVEVLIWEAVHYPVILIISFGCDWCMFEGMMTMRTR